MTDPSTTLLIKGRHAGKTVSPGTRLRHPSFWRKVPESELWSVGTYGVQIQETEDACGNQIIWSLHGHFTTPAKTGPALLTEWAYYCGVLSSGENDRDCSTAGTDAPRTCFKDKLSDDILESPVLSYTSAND